MNKDIANSWFCKNPSFGALKEAKSPYGELHNKITGYRLSDWDDIRSSRIISVNQKEFLNIKKFFDSRCKKLNCKGAIRLSLDNDCEIEMWVNEYKWWNSVFVRGFYAGEKGFAMEISHDSEYGIFETCEALIMYYMCHNYILKGYYG